MKLAKPSPATAAMMMLELKTSPNMAASRKPRDQARAKQTASAAGCSTESATTAENNPAHQYFTRRLDIAAYY